MRNAFWIGILVAGQIMVSSFAKAAEISTEMEKEQPRVLLKINPVYLLLSELSMAVEIRAGKFTFGPIGNYAPEHSYPGADDDALFSVYSNERYSRYSYGAQGKYYFRSLDRHSAYVGAMSQYSSITVKFDQGAVTYSGKQDFLEIGVLGGYQWNWSNFILNVGGGFKNMDAQGDFEFRSTNGDSSNREAFGNSLAGLILDIGLGYSF